MTGNDKVRAAEEAIASGQWQLTGHIDPDSFDEGHLMTGAPTPLIELRLVGPKQAAAWLARVAPDHRPPSPPQVARLARRMDDGTWSPMRNDPIAIDATGGLRGGRMRLLAVQEHGKPVRMWVAVSPPVLPYQLRPMDYVVHDPEAAGPRVQALRFDGTNAQHIADWVARGPEPGVEVETRDGATLVLRPGGPPAWWSCCYPGDWVVRTTGGYSCAPHHEFAPSFRLATIN